MRLIKVGIFVDSCRTEEYWATAGSTQVHSQGGFRTFLSKKLGPIKFPPQNNKNPLHA